MHANHVRIPFLKKLLESGKFQKEERKYMVIFKSLLFRINWKFQLKNECKKNRYILLDFWLLEKMVGQWTYLLRPRTFTWRVELSKNHQSWLFRNECTKAFLEEKKLINQEISIHSIVNWHWTVPWCSDNKCKLSSLYLHICLL